MGGPSITSSLSSRNTAPFLMALIAKFRLLRCNKGHLDVNTTPIVKEESVGSLLVVLLFKLVWYEVKNGHHYY